METSKPGKTAYLRVAVWWEEGTDIIHMAAEKTEDGFRTSVRSDPSSPRGHPSLFKGLSKCLGKAGVPHPKIEETEGD